MPLKPKFNKGRGKIKKRNRILVKNLDSGGFNLVEIILAVSLVIQTLLPSHYYY